AGDQCEGLFSRQQRTKSWTTGSPSLAGGQATQAWLGLTPVTGQGITFNPRTSAVYAVINNSLQVAQ
ncbi:MAG: hypothetical protein ACRDOU_26960, partial [Streptosporangiaceae bacterium]